MLLVATAVALVRTRSERDAARAERDAARSELRRIDDAMQSMVVHGGEAIAQMQLEGVEPCGRPAAVSY